MAGSLNISTEPQAWRSAEDLTSYVGSEVENYGEDVVTDDKNICAAGYASYCLTPDGKLTLCPSFPSVIGDLKMSSFIDVLNSPHLAFWKKTKRSDYKECGQKDYCKFCAPCPGLNYTKSGSPFVPSENNCYLAKMRKEVADMLKAGSDPLDGASSIEEALCRLPMYTNNHIEITKHKSYYAAWWHTLIIALLLAHQSRFNSPVDFFSSRVRVLSFLVSSCISALVIIVVTFVFAYL